MHTNLHDMVLRADRPNDEMALRRLAALDSVRPIKGRALVAEIDGQAIAAIGIEDGRVVADPFEHTAQAVELLKVRAQGMDHAAPRRHGLFDRFRTVAA
ncbi:MAG: hypothetical protein QOG68_2129 [Solirubrobacteraceae bacterium]|nr:hypothetical protein [Solirubrobacteraceae bacterium]